MANETIDFFSKSFDGHSMKASHLQHVPKMKDCENWTKVEFLGRVKHEFKLSKLDGGLVRYNGKIYYININQIMVLAGLYKWNTGKSIKVLPDE
jgi:hypothetical protein